MDPDQVLEKTKKELRSLLISAPRGVAVSLLAKDYRMVMGKELPYRELGCRNVEQFIHSIPDTIRVAHGPAGLTCYAVANAETQQIARFVASQKKPSLKKSLKPPPVAIRQPMKMSGFTKKSHFGPGSSRPRKFHNAGGGGGYPPTNRPPQQQYIPAGYHVRPGGPSGSGPPGPGGSNKFGKPFHAKQQQAPVTTLPPRLMRSSTSTYDATPSSGSSALLTRPSSAGNFQSLPTKTSTSPVKQSLQVNQSKRGISPIRFPTQQERVQVKTRPASGSTLARVYPWKKDFERAESISINQLNREHLVGNKVCTVGYIASLPIKELSSKYGMAVKRLLFTNYQGAGRGLAVLLVFKSSKNIETHSQQEFSDAICQIPEGTKLKVYGESFVHLNKKKNNRKEPGVDVWYYEKADESLSNGRSNTPSSHGSPSSSRSLTPPTSQPPTSQMSSGDRSALDQEITALLKGKLNGIYGRRLGKEYERFFNKPAPPDVMEYAKALPFVKWEEIVEDNPIFSLIESKAPSSDQPPVREQQNITNVPMATRSAMSAPTTPVSSTVKFVTEKPPVPGTVELGGSGDVCDVQVVVIESVLSFYVQRMGEGFSDKFQSMEKSMSAYLSRNAVPPLTSLAVDTLYAMRWTEDETGGGGGEEIWCRVLIRTIQKDHGKAYVLFPDFGNSLLVSTSDLKDLPREFFELPFQAVHCCLHGFRGVDYIDEDKAYEAFDSRALNKSCVAQVMESSGSRVLVELIDSESDGKETINSLLLQELCSEAKLTPVLPEPGAQKVPVTLTDIYMDGVVTVQLVGPGLDQLEHLMTIINETYEKPRAADFINKVEVGMLCCAVFSHDHRWYRALVKEVEESKKFMVEFVDYGNEEVVEKSKLRKGLDHHLFKLPFQAVKCSLHGLPPPEGQWTDSAIDTLMGYLDCENMYLQVMDRGDASVGRLPAIKLLIDNEEELDDGEGEILDINGLLLSDPLLFGLGGGSCSELFDVEAAVQPPVTSATPEKPADDTNGVAPSDSSLSKALDTISDRVVSMKLSESVHQSEEVAFTKNSVESEAVQQKQEVPIEHTCSTRISPVVNASSSAAAAAPELGGALNRSENSTNLQSDSPLPLEETASLVVNGAAGLNGSNNSIQPLEVENILTPPSSSESNSMFSPHTPSGSPSHLGGGSSPLEGSSTHLGLSPLNSKIVHVDSSSSLASSGPFSPHTPQGSPSAGTAPVHFLIGSAAGGIACIGGGGTAVGIDVVKGGLNFASLELKSTVPVIIPWAASPNKFTMQLSNNLNALDSMMNELFELMNVADPTSNSLSFDAIQPGLVCCGLSEDQWYRVLVLEPPSSSTGDVKVEFLDYGGTENVGVSSLRLLPEKFTVLPFQGISSSLWDTSSSLEGQGWSSEALEYFESLYTDKQLFAVVVSKDTVKTRVHLLDTVSVPGKTLNLGQELVAKGFAKMKAL